MGSEAPTSSPAQGGPTGLYHGASPGCVGVIKARLGPSPPNRRKGEHRNRLCVVTTSTGIQAGNAESITADGRDEERGLQFDWRRRKLQEAIEQLQQQLDVLQRTLEVEGRPAIKQSLYEEVRIISRRLRIRRQQQLELAEAISQEQPLREPRQQQWLEEQRDNHEKRNGPRTEQLPEQPEEEEEQREEQTRQEWEEQQEQRSGVPQTHPRLEDLPHPKSVEMWVSSLVEEQRRNHQMQSSVRDTDSANGAPFKSRAELSSAQVVKSREDAEMGQPFLCDYRSQFKNATASMDPCYRKPSPPESRRAITPDQGAPSEREGEGRGAPDSGAAEPAAGTERCASGPARSSRPMGSPSSRTRSTVRHGESMSQGYQSGGARDSEKAAKKRSVPRQGTKGRVATKGSPSAEESESESESRSKSAGGSSSSSSSSSSSESESSGVLTLSTDNINSVVLAVYSKASDATNVSVRLQEPARH